MKSPIIKPYNSTETDFHTPSEPKMELFYIYCLEHMGNLLSF